MVKGRPRIRLRENQAGQCNCVSYGNPVAGLPAIAFKPSPQASWLRAEDCAAGSDPDGPQSFRVSYFRKVEVSNTFAQSPISVVGRCPSHFLMKSCSRMFWFSFRAWARIFIASASAFARTTT